MAGKRILWTVVIILAATAMIILAARFLGGDEDTWLCQDGVWTKHGNPSEPMPTTGCGVTAEPTDTSTNTGLANPASVNCEQKGGKLEMKTDETGGQYAMCVFPDGKQCEEWAMFRGECPVGGVPAYTTSLTKPAEGELIVGPYVVSGSMPGNWYFEATARVELYDGDGKLIASAPAQAKGDWMTTGSVPFEAKLEFKNPAAPVGTLVLKNDNPSGLKENDRSETYPVAFGQKVTVFFNNSIKDKGGIECTNVYGTERVIKKTTTVGKAALEELLKGPTEAEKADGFVTNINPGVTVKSLTISDGIAKVDFDKQIQYQLGGSCRVTAIRAQITQTLKQFPTVKEVVISVEGNVDEALQP
ncbi:MAG: DUF333 domain-containing protein [Patescibacteria group bacterium]|nr:DUF333 domain-containing protein [Patescibacteria group bacterium]